MKKTKKLLIAALVPLMLLSGCSVDKDYGPDEETVKLVAPTNVVSKYAAGNQNHTSEATKKTTKVRVHYRRNDDTENNRQVYEPWNLWAWDIGNGGNGAAYEFTHYDDYGVYLDLDLSVIGGGQDVKTVGFIVRTNDWAKDPDGDRSFEVLDETAGGIQDIYLKSKDTTVFTSATNALKSTIQCAVMKSFKDVDVFFKPLTKTFKSYPKRFSILINGEEYKDFTMGEYNDTAKSVSLKLKDDLDITDTIKVCYKFDSEWTNEVPLMITSYFDSAEFKNNFSYTGNDLGATFDNEAAPTKTTFKVWAPTSKSVRLKVYNSGNYDTDKTPVNTYVMTKGEKGVYAYTVNENLDGKYYTYEVVNSKGTNEVVDPYAKSAGVNGRRGMVVNFTKLNSELVGWAQDTRPNFGNSAVDSSIYEMHVRDMTINPNSGVSEANRGKFLGLTEKGTTVTVSSNTYTTGLDHLKELGISHVQIQPMYDYSSVDETNVPSNMSKTNYNWGYDPQNYNVIEGSYSTNPRDGYNRIKELKKMVMAMHNEGIGITMDVVYNHTASTENSNFNLLVPYYYYRTMASGAFYNGSGCGNEMASDRYMVNKFVRESCKFWTDEYHLGGFRFDLMGLLDNQTMIDVYNDCKAIDPKIMVYGEPWTGGTSKLKDGTDATKLTGQKTVQSSLAQSYFSGSNVLVGAFNDVIRNGIRGDNGPGRGYVQGLLGNAINLKQGIIGTFSTGNTTTASINPNQVINYVSCHDNYTLNDQLVQSLNTQNINAQYTQAESLVFLSQGVPFLQEGEEFRRSKFDSTTNHYEGNSYNTGDFDNNMNYELKNTYKDVNDKFKELIQFRKDNPEFRLSSRSEITEKVKNLNANAGTITYNINNLLVVHSVNAAQITLDGTYDVVYSNTRSTYGTGLTGTFMTNQNESVVLRKVA